MNIITIKEHPEFEYLAIRFFQKHWASKESMAVYEDCIHSSMRSKMPLPQWYILMDGDNIIGGAGLITNDFISRMDLYPWICALFIDEAYRGHQDGEKLLEKAKCDAKDAGFKHVYVCSDHVGFYEHYNFHYIGKGYHPWGEVSSIYEADI